MNRSSIVTPILLLSMGCASGEMSLAELPGPGPDSGTTGDSEEPDTTTDAGPVTEPDGAPVPNPVPHLLLTEVTLAPTGSEFIEVANLTGSSVDLSHYYLSDTDRYMYTPGLRGSGPNPDVSSPDFIAAFPAGTNLADGDVAVIAIDGNGFASAFGILPDYCLAGTNCTNMLGIDVGTGPTLTNAGEPIILFYWDGSEDLVRDVDIVAIGSPSVANPPPDKSSGNVDGPDADTAASTYAADQMSMSSGATAPGADLSIKRVALEGGSEILGGNGITGDDETTEDLSTSWDDAPFTAPTPGQLPASLIP